MTIATVSSAAPSKPSAEAPVQWWRAAIAPFVIAAVFQALIDHAAGGSLGTFIGAFVAMVVIVPPLAARESQLVLRLTSTAACVVAIALVTLFVIGSNGVSFSQWLHCSLLIAVFGVAVLGLIELFLLLRFGLALSAFVACVLGTAWLAWPVWLSPMLSRPAVARHVDAIVSVSPIFAANGVLKNLGIWTERGIIYRLTTLNQHVFYVLPSTIAWCVAAHLGLGAVLILLSRVVRRPLCVSRY